jgi:LysR family transcriptional activator of glutamate synthase operon
MHKCYKKSPEESMNLNQLEVFRKAAELQNVSRAAQELRVAQPAVSKTIRGLEEELGARLFDRVGRRVALNENGRILLRHVNAAFRNLDDAREALRERGERPQPVTITMTCASKLLPALVSGFRERHPDVPLSVGQQAEGSGAADSDVYIFQANSPVSGENTRLLIAEEVFLAVPAGHPLAGRASLELIEAAGEDFIALSPKKQFRRSADEYCRRAGFEPKIALESDDPATIRSLIQHGFGFSFMPAHTWGRLEDPAIARVRLCNPGFMRYIYVTWKKEGGPSGAAGLFVEYLTGFFRELEAGRRDA